MGLQRLGYRYPIGRPVGTTIYPAMQIIAVSLWRMLEAAGTGLTLNDVCCYIPAWFGAVATAFTALIAWEATGGSAASAVVAAAVMSIVPAHLQRSVGGGFDNESVAKRGFFFSLANISAHADGECRGASANLNVPHDACHQDLSTAILGSVVCPRHAPTKKKQHSGDVSDVLRVLALVPRPALATVVGNADGLPRWPRVHVDGGVVGRLRVRHQRDRRPRAVPARA